MPCPRGARAPCRGRARRCVRIPRRAPGRTAAAAAWHGTDARPPRGRRARSTRTGPGRSPGRACRAAGAAPLRRAPRRRAAGRATPRPRERTARRRARTRCGHPSDGRRARRRARGSKRHARHGRHWRKAAGSRSRFGARFSRGFCLLTWVLSTLARTPVKFYLVDDDPEVLALLARLLEDAGHRVQASASSVAALKEIPAARPDCVITDIMMPVMDGFELTRELRRRPELSRLK